MLTFVLSFAFLSACATSPTGRKQVMLVSQDQMNQLGAQSFDQIKQQTPVSTDAKQNAFVQCVAHAITEAAKGKPNVPDQWEVVVFNAPDTINAFALPGGKIGVYSGILPVTKTDAQLAAVLGHETGHVIAGHSAERISNQMLTEQGLAIVGGATHGNPYVGAALGLGAQFGILLPFSRTQESEADVIGLNLMAEAGFDPQQAVELWKNMETATKGSAPPEFFSSHPSDPNRIQNLEQHMPEALKKYDQAKARGLKPSCPHP